MLRTIRRRLLLGLAVLVPLGIGTKFYTGPGAVWVQSHGGGLLYVVFWVMVVALVVPDVAPWKAGLGVLGVTCGLEALQLWHPWWLEAVRRTFVGHALVGSTFSWTDLPHYVVGAALGVGLVRAFTPTAPHDPPRAGRERRSGTPGAQ